MNINMLNITIKTRYSVANNILSDCPENAENLYNTKIIGKYGVIDDDENIIIPFIYDSIKNFNDGYFKIKLNGKFGIIDYNNNIIIEPIYDDIGVFFDGLDDVRLFFVLKDNKYGILTKDFNFKINLILDDINLLRTPMHNIISVSIDGKYLLYDNLKNEFINLNYKYIDNFNDQYLKVLDYDDNYGLIDFNGNIIIPCMYKSISSCCLDYYIVKKDKKYTIIDINNNQILNYYDEISKPSNYLINNNYFYIKVKLSEHNYNIYDLINNKFIFKNDYKQISFKDDYYIVKNKLDFLAAFDLLGNMILDFKFDDIYIDEFSHGEETYSYFKVKYYDKYYLYYIDGYKLTNKNAEYMSIDDIYMYITKYFRLNKILKLL